MHRPKNIQTQEEKESDSVERTVEASFTDEFRGIVIQIKGVGDILGLSRSLRDSVNKLEDCHTGPMQRNQR